MIAITVDAICKSVAAAARDRPKHRFVFCVISILGYAVVCFALAGGCRPPHTPHPHPNGIPIVADTYNDWSIHGVGIGGRGAAAPRQNEAKDRTEHKNNASNRTQTSVLGLSLAARFVC